MKTDRLPRIALSGAPCTGKTTALKMLKDRLGGEVRVVPEIAAFVFDAELFPPPNESEDHRFAEAISSMRMALEDMADVQRTRRPELEAIIVDRAVHDAAAYLEGGINELAEAIRKPVWELHDRYDLVLYFTVPARHILEFYWKTKSYRIDDIAIVDELDRKTRATWVGHPNVVEVPAAMMWEERCETIEREVRHFIARCQGLI